MPQIDWNSIMNGTPQQRSRWSGANVRFKMVVRKNEVKSLEAGRDIFDEVPSISIQWPGGDETVRAIEEQDKYEHAAAYQAFIAGAGEVQSGMPLQEWPKITASAIHELAYLGFRTVEQLAQANDEVRRKMGPLSKYIKEAQEWMSAASSTQAEVVSLREQLERERVRVERMENQIELLMQRIEGNEGIRWDRPQQTTEVEAAPRPRGRPRKVEE